MRWVPASMYESMPQGPRLFARRALAAGWKVGVTDVGGVNLVVRAQRPDVRIAACWVKKKGRWSVDVVLAMGADSPIMSVTQATTLLNS